jgi:hypothetical protein
LGACTGAVASVPLFKIKAVRNYLVGDDAGEGQAAVKDKKE